MTLHGTMQHWQSSPHQHGFVTFGLSIEVVDALPLEPGLLMDVVDGGIMACLGKMCFAVMVEGGGGDGLVWTCCRGGSTVVREEQLFCVLLALLIYSFAWEEVGKSRCALGC